MALVLIGIDEAGFGPMLGPLCVASSTFTIEDWTPGDPAPNLWDALEAIICISKRDAKTRIPIDDSKKLKLSNQTKTKHPLVHLERAVLTMLSAMNPADHTWPATDADLFARLGSPLPDPKRLPWYVGEPRPLPLGTPAGSLSITANTLRAELQRTRIAPVELRCRVMFEDEYNDTLAQFNTKAATTGVCVHQLIGEAWQRDETRIDSGHGVRLVLDRQGGRTKYAAYLAHALPTATIETVHETNEASVYDAFDADRSMRFIIRSEAESAFMPVALASMTAKLCRELLMGRFNAYWAERVADLKPTAGYVQDARRWLIDAASAISPEDRALMIRKA